MIKVIIFDFFDVIRSDPYNAWLKRHSLVRDGDFLDASQQLDIGQIDNEAFRKLLSRLSGEAVENINQEFDSVTEVDTEVVGIIKNLRKQYKTALLTNSPSVLLRSILRDNDLEKYFDEIVISSEVGLVKPNKEIFELILERLSISASEALFIDDSKHHVDGAEKAGIKGIQFLSADKLKTDLLSVGINLS